MPWAELLMWAGRQLCGRRWRCHVRSSCACVRSAVLTCSSPLQSGNFDAAAALQSKRLPVESAMPGTTLGLIQLKSFESGGCLYGEQCPAHTICIADLSGDCAEYGMGLTTGLAPGAAKRNISCAPNV